MFTIGVFQDVTWAARGIEALVGDGFPVDSLSIVAKATPEARALIAARFGGEVQVLTLSRLGEALVCGPLIAALQGSDGGLERGGVSAAIGRAGFQSHDGHIYERLVDRGGILVAVHNLPRAADALGKLHAYGGGNAAIGAWIGRMKPVQFR
jgi:hypothetical protein